jgi:hypothetical protein
MPACLGICGRMLFETPVPAEQGFPFVILHGAQRCDLHKGFKPSRVYDRIAKLWKQKAEVLQNNENTFARSTEEGED